MLQNYVQYEINLCWQRAICRYIHYKSVCVMLIIKRIWAALHFLLNVLANTNYVSFKCINLSIIIQSSLVFSKTASPPQSTEDFQDRSKYARGCCWKQTLLLYLLCCVPSGMWYFTLGIRCVWGCGEHQTDVRISSLASLAGFPHLADLPNKHLPCSLLKVNDSQQMCCCKAP